MCQKSMGELLSIKSVHTLNRAFLVSLLAFAKMTTRNILLKILELWKEALDKGKSVGAIFMELFKTFDILNRDFLIAKLETYGFSKNSLKFIHSYLRNRLQRTNVNNNFSLWKDMLILLKDFAGVPEGLILGSLMFDIYINDTFLFLDNVCLSNYAGDNTLYSIEENHNNERNTLNKKFLSLQK